MDRMDAEIRADDLLKEIFIDRQWFPRDMFNSLQTSIREHVAAIFQRLTAEKVRERDTRTEYARVNRLILSGCPDPFHHSVVRGESLWRIAEFYYGDGSQWQRIYDANRATIGSNPNLIRPGQNLLIPKP
jgi:nucleoid-associated protein YgaU